MFQEIARFFSRRKQDESRAITDHQALLAATSGFVFTVDPQGVLYDNLGKNFHSNIDANDLLGRRLSNLVMPEFLSAISESLNKVFVHKQVAELVCEMTIGSRPHSIEMRIAPSAFDHAIVIIQEITENRRLEEQLRNSQRTEIIGRLAIGLAHDFNNLLMIVSGYCHLLLANLPEKSSSHSQVRAISRASERASTLTLQLLNFGRNVKLSPQIIDLNQVISGTDRLLALLAGENFRLQTSLAPDLNYVKIDKSEIERVLMNLIINARDAMPQGGDIIVETTNVVLDENFARKHKNVVQGSYVMLTVRDTGEGIGEENLSKIFEPYFTTKGHRHGVGLGLSTVVDIVKQNKGHISVESKLGHGTAFKIYLPRVRRGSEVLADDSAYNTGGTPPWTQCSFSATASNGPS